MTADSFPENVIIRLSKQAVGIHTIDALKKETGDTMGNENEEYVKHFSEEDFWGKILRYGKEAGVKLTYGALLLYYTFKKPSVPKATKATILGALGYFISPLDIVPDFIPIAGYGDDLSVVIGALIIVATYIDTESKQLARAKVVDWFGEKAAKDTYAVDEDIDSNQQGRKEKKAARIQNKQEKKDSKQISKAQKKERKNA